MRVLALSLIVAMGAGSAALAADKPVVKPFTAPSAGPQYFLWIEGGYSHFDLPRVHAFDTGAPLSPIYFDVDDGWFGRAEAGFVPAQRLGWIDAISIAGGYREGSDDKGRSGVPVGLGYLLPPTTITNQFNPGTATAHHDFSLFDLQLRLKHAAAAWPGFTINVEPFFGRARNDASATVVTETRTARVDGDIYGVQGAIEGRRPWTDRIALRGRVSLGAYYLNADGVFAIGPFAARTDSFSKDFGGLRAGAEFGVDLALAPSIMLGVTAGVDHWSKMPFARLTEMGPPTQPAVGIGTGNFTDYFVGARLTFVTGPR